MNAEEKEKLLDLLTQRAVYGLSADEQRELDEIQVDKTYRDDASFDLAAAAIALTEIDAREEMPAHLKSRILASANDYFGDTEQDEMQKTFAFEPKRSVASWLGWLVAAAACVALAVNIFWTRQQAPQVITVGPTPSPTVEKLDPRKDFEAMFASAGVVKALVGPPPKAPAELAQVAGDVVWSDAKQAGYIKVKGLPKNDTAKTTYQIWIFDENQDPKHPIDGGTFDVTVDGEVLIPIDAKIAVRNPKMFAITAEKAGGVVVSDRKRMAALGQVAKSDT
ncbi:MAG: anti-sigma factor [Blastocatellia bacterium]|nr:anti-sigma factor [Blastocatellia bacterium]